MHLCDFWVHKFDTQPDVDGNPGMSRRSNSGFFVNQRAVLFVVERLQVGGSFHYRGVTPYPCHTGDIEISMMHGARFMQDSSLHPPKKIKQSSNSPKGKPRFPLFLLTDLRKMFAATFADPSVNPFGWIYVAILWCNGPCSWPRWRGLFRLIISWGALLQPCLYFKPRWLCPKMWRWPQHGSFNGKNEWTWW